MRRVGYTHLKLYQYRNHYCIELQKSVVLVFVGRPRISNHCLEPRSHLALLVHINISIEHFMQAFFNYLAIYPWNCKPLLSDTTPNFIRFNSLVLLFLPSYA
jgi:hypothetical protein